MAARGSGIGRGRFEMRRMVSCVGIAGGSVGLCAGAGEAAHGQFLRAIQ